jgi:ABC-type Zn2+ transport system substrate-binding protein/surface adhesin
MYILLQAKVIEIRRLLSIYLSFEKQPKKRERERKAAGDVVTGWDEERWEGHQKMHTYMSIYEHSKRNRHTHTHTNKFDIHFRN